MRWTLNRPRNEVWKEADEQRVIDERLRRLEFSVVDVDDVRDSLKRIERNPRRQEDSQRRDRRRRHPERRHQPFERLGEEIEILEYAEETEVEDQRERQEAPPAPCDRRRGDVTGGKKIDDRRSENQRKKPPVPPAVKEVAGRQQENVLARPRRQAPVDHHDRDEEDEIDGCIEEHMRARVDSSSASAWFRNRRITCAAPPWGSTAGRASPARRP